MAPSDGNDHITVVTVVRLLMPDILYQKVFINSSCYMLLYIHISRMHIAFMFLCTWKNMMFQSHYICLFLAYDMCIIFSILFFLIKFSDVHFKYDDFSKKTITTAHYRNKNSSINFLRAMMQCY